MRHYVGINTRTLRYGRLPEPKVSARYGKWGHEARILGARTHSGCASLNEVVTRISGRPLRRRPSRKVRRNRTVAALVVIALAALLVVWVNSGGSGASRPSKHSGRVTATRGTRSQRPRVIPVLEAELLPWSLKAPLSRMIVEPSTGSELTVLGGYDGASSADGVYDLDSTDGNLRLVGDLAEPTHDAAGALLGGRDLVIGGGNAVSDAAVQAIIPGAGIPTAATIGQLPDARSDCVAVSIGGTVYVVGGYDGTNGDPSVLATTDGQNYRTITSLPVPVRYPAVAALGGEIYVIGGEAVGGSDDGQAIRDIQVVNPQAGTARVLGSMPVALEGASAVTISGHIYVAGGNTASSGTTTNSSATIWVFDPASRTLLREGKLRVAVSNAGVAVIGTTAWLVGGETDGVVSAAVQMFHLGT